MRKRSTASDLPTTRPDGPGFYREDLEGRPVVWVSWWNPSWSPSSQTEDAYRSPQDRLQLTQGEDSSGTWAPGVAVQGVRLLGAHETQNEGYRAMLALRFLAMQKQKADPVAADERALQRLINALEKYGRDLRERLSTLPYDAPVGAPELLQAQALMTPDIYGPPYGLGTSSLPVDADEVLASMLEHIGERGRDLAERIREESHEALLRHRSGEIGEEEIWQPWFPTIDGRPPARHAALLRAIWQDVVRPGLAKVPAFTRAVYSPVVGLLAQRAVHLDASTGERTLTSGSAVLARIVNVDATALRYFDRGLEKLDSIHAHRLLFHLAKAGHDGALAGILDPRALHYVGGYSALAEACGIHGDKGTAHVRAIVETLASLDVSLGSGRWAQLFSRDFTEAKGRRQAQLTITLGTVLLPNYVHELQARTTERGLASQRALDLIPLLPPPPMLGQPNLQGRQATLALRVVSHLRDHARELVTHGGAPLPLPRFVELAQASRLSAAMAPRVLEHWLEDHRDGPALLKRTGTDRYTLGDTHLTERLFLEQSGQRSLNGQARGVRSARKRAQNRKLAARTERSSPLRGGVRCRDFWVIYYPLPIVLPTASRNSPPLRV